MSLGPGEMAVIQVTGPAEGQTAFPELVGEKRECGHVNFVTQSPHFAAE